MKEFRVKSPVGEGKLYIHDQPLGKGGEGSVYLVDNHNLSGILPAADDLVCKIYHDNVRFQGNREEKVNAMVSQRPDTDSVAFPYASVYDANGFVGYVMQKLSQDSYRIWAEFTSARQRTQLNADFDVRYALTAAYNFGVAMKSVHEAGHCLGDVNESNVFISGDATVFIVDTDSAQIKDSSGKVYPCLVGKPEYTASELTHGSFADNPRTTATDTFAYGVMVYQILLGGAHPTAGIYNLPGDPESVTYLLHNEVFPNFDGPSHGYGTVPRIHTEGIPTRIRTVLRRTFTADPAKRATLDELLVTIGDVITRLEECDKVRTHFYDKRDKRCLWCEATVMDVWNVGGVATRSEDERNAFLKKNAPSIIPKAKTVDQLVNFYEYKSPRIDVPKKKNKTILEYSVNGSVRPRPSYGSLWQQNPGLLVKCFINEMPEAMRLYYHLKHEVVTMKGLLAGLGIGSALVMLYFFFGGFLISKLVPEYTTIVNNVWQWGSVVTLAAVLTVFFTGLYEWWYLHRNVDLEGVPDESIAVTARGFIFASVFWSPLVLSVVGFFYLFYLLIGFLGYITSDIKGRFSSRVSNPDILD